MNIKFFGTIAIFTAFLVTSCAESEAPAEEKAQLPLVKTYTAEKKAFKHEIRIQGSVETDKDVLLGAEMSGILTSVNIKEGQVVKAGQVVAVIDASILASNYEEMKTQLEYAQYMLDKQEELHKRGVGSEFDLKTARNQVESLKASMNSLNTQRGKASIKAPFSGVIDAVYAKTGQMTGPQSPIARLVNNTNVDIVATLSESHLQNVKVGTPITVRFPNYSDTIIHLNITNVGNYIEPTNRTFRIMSELKNNKLLLPNMLTEISITDFAAENGMVVPSISVSKDQDNNDYVFVAQKTEKGLKATKIIVQVISEYNGETLIENGAIAEGQQVIVEGARGILENDIVRIK
jgi:RND family efflux transporter MFP subunit